MDMNELVKFLVKPFLEGLDEDTNLEYDGSVPAAKPGDDFKDAMLKSKKGLKKLKQFLINNKTTINENLVTQLVDGGTNELSPFASVEGYYKYSLERSENSGYKFLKDTFDPEYVYGNEKSTPPTNMPDSELQKILEAYDKIDDLYLEYVMKFDDGVMARDDSNYDSLSGDIDDTEDMASQKKIPKNPVLGNGYDGDPSDTKTDYKHEYDRTPNAKHI